MRMDAKHAGTDGSFRRPSRSQQPVVMSPSEAKSEKDEIEEHRRLAIAILHTLHTRTHHDQYNRKLVLPTVRSRKYDAPPIT